MSLALLFEQSAAPATWATFAVHPQLEVEPWRLYDEGRASWPSMTLEPQQLVGFLARHLPPEAAAPKELSVLRARDLYLVCALERGERAAQEIFERDYMPRVRRALLQLGTPEPIIADIQQNLYGRLLEKQDAAVVRRGYSGRGELSSWLCTCAVREAGLRHKRDTKELALEHASEDVMRDLRKSPEAMVLSGHLKADFQAAFREAVGLLTSRERNLLRYHFLAELSIDQIGTIYQVHRATAARWLTRAQERLIRKTRELFLLRTQSNADSLPQIMELIQSQLSINLGNILKRSTESDSQS